jgi:hypothetical protein
MPSPRRDGVPTAMKTASAAATAAVNSGVKVRRSPRMLFAIRSLRPGSKIGTAPRFKAEILSWSYRRRSPCDQNQLDKHPRRARHNRYQSLRCASNLCPYGESEPTGLRLFDRRTLSCNLLVCGAVGASCISFRFRNVMAVSLSVE